jgi:subtilase family serine protease
MINRTFVLASTVTIALALSLSAVAQPVERSGQVYHKAVCGPPSAPRQVRCHAHIVTDAKGEPISDATTSGAPRGYGPADLASAYAVTATGDPSMVIAIVDAFGYSTAEAYLAVYRAKFGLPPCTTDNGCFRKINQSGVEGSYPPDNLSWDREQALDLDMVSAICPACSILLVEANSQKLADIATAVNTAAAYAWPGGSVRAISNSYGGVERGSTPYDFAYKHPGIAVTVSSGDKGYGVEFPATSEWVTAVGGTTLVRAQGGRGWSETAWSGAGSGCSAIYPMPAWQQGVTDAACSMRMEADVSAVADPLTGVAVFSPTKTGTGAWHRFGGTSVAAPIIAALYALNGQGANYGADPYAHPGALFDVTAGSNGSCGGTYLCSAGAGYDGPTGLGTPDGTTAF